MLLSGSMFTERKSLKGYAKITNQIVDRVKLGKGP